MPRVPFVCIVGFGWFGLSVVCLFVCRWKNNKRNLICVALVVSTRRSVNTDGDQIKRV